MYLFASRISKFVYHPLFSGSVVMIFGSNLANILNYAYHLIMGRLLGPSAYGELATLFSILGLLGIIPLSFHLVVVKYISSAKTDRQVGGLIRWLKGKVVFFSLALSLTIVIGSPIASSFLNIKNIGFFVMVASIFFFSTLILINRAVLQGLLKFDRSIITIIVENSSKLFLGIAFVYLGFAVSGAILGLVMASVITWFLSTRFIRNYIINSDPSVPDIRKLFFYSFPVLIQSIALTSLYSTDLILVKHYFSSIEAGIYASLSTLGKIIFFGASPISNVMFPIISRRYSRGENFQKILIYSFVLTVIVALAILLVYWLIPTGAISILFGSLYLSASSLLVWFGIFITLLTLSSYIVNFHLSLGCTKVVILPVLAALAQIIGIILHHNNLWSVISVSITVNGLLFIGLFISLIFTVKRLALTK